MGRIEEPPAELDRQTLKQVVLEGSEKVLAKVHPVLRERTLSLISLLADDGLYFGAFMGLRTWEEQDALYAQGRTKSGRKVTNAKGGESWHNFGLAVDLVEDGDPNKAGIQWSWKNNADYLKIGRYAEQCGLEWGGWWKSFKDVPHVQMTHDMTLAEARFLYGKGGLDAVWEKL